MPESFFHASNALQRTAPRSLDQVTKRGFAHGSPPKADGSRWGLETQARKASRRDWLVLTSHEAGQEEEGEVARRQVWGANDKSKVHVVLIKSLLRRGDLKYLAKVAATGG